VAEARITRDDVESAVGARRELGSELEPEIVDAFLEKVERTIDARVAEDRRRSRKSGTSEGSSVALAIVSLGTGVPITAIAVEQAGTQGLIVAWLGIVGVNFAHRFKR